MYDAVNITTATTKPMKTKDHRAGVERCSTGIFQNQNQKYKPAILKLGNAIQPNNARALRRLRVRA